LQHCDTTSRPFEHALKIEVKVKGTSKEAIDLGIDIRKSLQRRKLRIINKLTMSYDNNLEFACGISIQFENREMSMEKVFPEEACSYVMLVADTNLGCTYYQPERLK
jgi:hypothetical protein